MGKFFSSAKPENDLGNVLSGWAKDIEKSKAREALKGYGNEMENFMASLTPQDLQDETRIREGEASIAKKYDIDVASRRVYGQFISEKRIAADQGVRANYARESLNPNQEGLFGPGNQAGAKENMLQSLSDQGLLNYIDSQGRRKQSTEENQLKSDKTKAEILKLKAEAAAKGSGNMSANVEQYERNVQGFAAVTRQFGAVDPDTEAYTLSVPSDKEESLLALAKQSGVNIAPTGSGTKDNPGWFTGDTKMANFAVLPYGAKTGDPLQASGPKRTALSTKEVGAMINQTGGKKAVEPVPGPDAPAAQRASVGGQSVAMLNKLKGSFQSSNVKPEEKRQYPTMTDVAKRALPKIRGFNDKPKQTAINTNDKDVKNLIQGTIPEEGINLGNPEVEKVIAQATTLLTPEEIPTFNALLAKISKGAKGEALEKTEAALYDKLIRLMAR